MDIQIKNVDAVIEATQKIETMIGMYGGDEGFGEDNIGRAFASWHSNAPDKQKIEEKFKKIYENAEKLTRAMKELNTAVSKYATNLKALSSNEIVR